jgi:hypothetical protein
VKKRADYSTAILDAKRRAQLVSEFLQSLAERSRMGANDQFILFTQPG